MTSKKHHTKRLLNSRRKSTKEYIKGFCNSYGREPTKPELDAYHSGFNSGYKHGRKHALNPKKQESPYKKTLDELFGDKISFQEALLKLNISEKKLHKLIDNYHYKVTSEDIHKAFLIEMESMKQIEEAVKNMEKISNQPASD